MTQNITIQIGQCGNQIGCRFWDLALREHMTINKNGYFDEALDSFFFNVDPLSLNGTHELKLGTRIGQLRARAVLVDTEEGVVRELVQKSHLRDLFDYRQLVTDVSGAGNNWAVGHHFYGEKYAREITELVRRSAERCDSLETFFLMHSMGGGTGSGLGTRILRLLADEFADVHRFVVAVYPSPEDDDVITSPYNCVLAMRQLTEYADCVMPIDNQSLIGIVNRVEAACNFGGANQQAGSGGTFASNLRKMDPSNVIKSSVTNNAFSSTNSNSSHQKSSSEKPFDSMNNIVANMLLNLTSSSRFDGSLNIDLNEITTNLVPFPRLHYLLTSLSPLYINETTNLKVRGIEQMFSDAFRRENQLLQCDPRAQGRIYLACALLLRGKVQLSDVRRNIEKLRTQLSFVSWNREGWKTGMCAQAAHGQSYSLLSLANNTCIRESFAGIRDRFSMLYKRKAHVHHYTQVDGMGVECFDEAALSLGELMNEYKELERHASLAQDNASHNDEINHQPIKILS